MWSIRSPVLFLLLPFAAGILSCALLPLFHSLAASFISLGFLFLFQFRGIPFRHSYLPGVLLMMSAFFGGTGSASLEKLGMERTAFSPGKGQYRLTERLGANERSIRFRGESLEGSRSVLLKVERTREGEELLPGDRVQIPVRPQAIPDAPDTTDFDRKGFYASQGIHFESEHEGSDLERSAPNGWMDPWTAALRWQEQLYRSIRDETPLEGDELAVASALWLGRKSELPDALREDYADAGGMHVLAVSGLHVGMIFLLLQGATRPLDRGRWGRRVRPLLILFLLWSYAALTGWSASVVRAVLMFSLYIVGQSLERSPGIANVIGGSALLILMCKPSMLTDIGFLLSYSAVIAIVSLYPSIERLFYSRWAFLRWLWSVLAVSLAAQIGVLPVLLFAFGKFPVWFELTNPLLLPLATLALYSGVPVALSFLIPEGPEWTGFLVEFLVSGMNLWVAWIAGLPGSGTEFSGFGFFPALLLSVPVLLLLLRVHYPFVPSWSIQLPLSFLLLFLFYQEWKWRREGSMIHHGWDRVSVLSVREGKKVKVLSSRTLNEYREQLLRDFWEERGVERFETELYGKKPWETAALRVADLDLFFWNGKLEKWPGSGPERFDLVIMAREARFRKEEGPVLEGASTALIFSEEVSEKTWKEAFREAPDSLHDIFEDRTYVARL